MLMCDFCCLDNYELSSVDSFHGDRREKDAERRKGELG